ncbi:MAG: PIG-L family deacetylase [Fimbriimonadaceae bacterium]|nr:PIG-L family deacetylase [Fimbriimonadaceae bacterium]
MTCFDTDPNLRWLLCITHPDDELAIAAWLRRLTRQGNEVFVSWTHTTDERTEEAIQAAKRIGIPKDRLLFHRGRDGHVVDDIPSLLPDFKQMMKTVNPCRVIVGAYEQGHLDHDATNFLVHQTYDSPTLEVPLYHAYYTWVQRLNRFADPATEEVIDLDEEEQAFKVELAHMYPSQTIWSALAWYEFMQLVRMNPVELKRSERMRVQTHFDYLTPNLPEHLAHRVRKTSRWARWESAMNQYAWQGLWNPAG